MAAPPRWRRLPQGEALQSSIGWVCLFYCLEAKGEDAAQMLQHRT